MLKICCRNNSIEAGCDEAGRGCLAGPVYAAAVILPSDYSNPLLNDSKQLNEKIRLQLREDIIANAVNWSVAQIDNVTIDKANILRASVMAMHLALDGLTMSPEHIIIDGNRFYKYKNIPHQCIVKGDSKYMSIAAASVLAKTFRDEFMIKADKEFPVYNWKENKGYATKFHREAIAVNGLSKYHRKTFNHSNNQLSLKFK